MTNYARKVGTNAFGTEAYVQLEAPVELLPDFLK